MVDHRDAGELLLEMVRIARVFRVASYRYRNISGTRVGILQRLKLGDARLGNLARQLGISAPVATRAVHALESDGLVERRTDDTDARASLISLTEHGRETVAERERHIAERFAQVLGDWEPEQTAQALDVLQQLNHHLDELTEILETNDRGEPNA